MRRRLVASAIAALSSLVLVAGCSAEAESDPLVLRVASGLSSQNLAWTEGVVPWMEEVEKATGGAVTFQSFTGGELVELKGETHALQTDVIDIALFLPTYQPDQYPLVEVSMLPLKQSDAVVGSEAWKNFVESDAEVYDGMTFHEWQFGSKGLKAIPLHTTGEYSIATTGSDMSSVAELKSLKLRAASRVQNITTDAFSGSTVSIPNAEAFDALSRGTIDGGFASVADWPNYGLQDLYQTTLTGMNFGHFNLNLMMTEEKWNSLDPEVRTIMETAIEDTYVDASTVWKDQGTATKEYNETEAGGEFIDISTLPPEVREQLEGSVVTTWDEWTAMLEEQGLPGREAAEEWRQAIIDAGGEVPDGILENGEG
ncbi:TRAP transporter substrate-binding protein DctP [Brevibacterium sp. CS2]|uniref:TRAP transporter substrate-binding protein DctP n=1 Tax=Brevibacterium sp. CS2 TaxID=2575923 RepID=UPI0010C7A6D9|nr:TRAP transporter substrate-binding protein DctP [Brevibacterium sp. CS2]QCP04079.1 TRAP transporter substrate-binding protein DctP [Brevibacterium sp. CS2]